MVGNSMDSESMPWHLPQKSTNLGKSAWVAGCLVPRSHPDENDSHFFQGIQSHYNTYLTQSQVIYFSFFAKIAPFFLDISCQISYNLYVN